MGLGHISKLQAIAWLQQHGISVRIHLLLFFSLDCSSCGLFLMQPFKHKDVNAAVARLGTREKPKKIKMENLGVIYN